MANRDYRKIERVMKDFSLSVGGGSDGFCVLLRITDERIKKYCPKQYEIVKPTEEEDEVLYTGSVSIVDIEGLEFGAIKLDVPMSQIHMVEYGKPSGRKFKLGFTGISSEFVLDEIGVTVGGNTLYTEGYPDEIKFEVNTYDSIGILPVYAWIYIEEGGQ